MNWKVNRTKIVEYPELPSHLLYSETCHTDPHWMYLILHTFFASIVTSQ